MAKYLDENGLLYFWNKIKAALGNKVDKVSGKGLSTNDYTTAEKTKLSGIETNANKYVHPTHTAKTSGLYKVTVDGSGHVSGTAAVAKSDITGLGIPGQDTTYSDMKGATASAAGTNGLVPAPAAGKQGQYLRGDGTWQNPPNTTYSTATQSANGLMSSADKKKIDGIEEKAEVNQNAFSVVNVNDTNINAMNKSSTLKIDAGTNISMEVSGPEGRFAINAKDTTYEDMKGATASAAGKNGLVPAPAAGSQSTKYLRADGTWQTPPDTKYSHPTGDGNLHMPATSTTHNGHALIAGSTAGSATWKALTKAMVGLSNVDNTSDASKPISTAVQGALRGKLSTTEHQEYVNAAAFDALEAGLHAYADGYVIVTDYVQYVVGNGFCKSRIKDGGGWQDWVLDNNFTDAYKTKLDGIAANANNYVHPTNDGNKHVPATGTTNNGKFLMAGSTAGSLSWGTPADTKYNDFTGATSSADGAHGLVPKPIKGNGNSVLFGDAKWKELKLEFENRNENGAFLSLNFGDSGYSRISVPASTTTGSGLMIPSDKTKLDALPTVATLNSTYAKKADIVGMYKYKGSVADSSKLPTTGRVTGDVYNIETASVYGGAGMNVAWNGTEWDPLGEIFTITSLSNSEIDTICA